MTLQPHLLIHAHCTLHELTDSGHRLLSTVTWGSFSAMFLLSPSLLPYLLRVVISTATLPRVEDHHYSSCRTHRDSDIISRKSALICSACILSNSHLLLKQIPRCAPRSYAGGWKYISEQDRCSPSLHKVSSPAPVMHLADWIVGAFTM